MREHNPKFDLSFEKKKEIEVEDAVAKKLMEDFPDDFKIKTTVKKTVMKKTKGDN